MFSAYISHSQYPENISLSGVTVPNVCKSKMYSFSNLLFNTLVAINSSNPSVSYLQVKGRTKLAKQFMFLDSLAWTSSIIGAGT